MGIRNLQSREDFYLHNNRTVKMKTYLVLLKLYVQVDACDEHRARQIIYDDLNLAFDVLGDHNLYDTEKTMQIIGSMDIEKIIED